jgi:DNA modification methylase
VTERLPRLDTNPEIRERLLPLCRLASGEIWIDPLGRHAVSVADAADSRAQGELVRAAGGDSPVLLIADPPYNFAVGGRRSEQLFSADATSYAAFSRSWMQASLEHLADDANIYVWLGADQGNGFQPLPEFMLMMRDIPEVRSRSMITMRNQRGYGTQKNWMSVRQELLYYVRGNPPFFPQYTDIPRLLQGYYKDEVSNSQRSRSPNIRPGNVWVDIQQVFYRLEENVPGSYAQKPVKALERVILSSSKADDLVMDPFAHSGTTLLAAERTGRRCITCDIDPLFAEISIRRLERFRSTGKTGWQWESPFPELYDGTV